jgi:serine-type D-Ala-D-Ala carboxypeptidase/endopeptidase
LQFLVSLELKDWKYDSIISLGIIENLVHQERGVNKSLKRLFVIFLLLSLPQYAPAVPDGPNATGIEEILKERVDKKKSVGIVVGWIDDKETKIVGYGKLNADSKERPDGDTIFEIGSITKVFTSILLADMVQRGELSLNDPISKFLPKSVKIPVRNGKEITLLDLATHTSGLPRMPTNFNSKDWKDPYADYTVENMYDFLSNYTLTRDIGEKYQYSNYGFGLLGHILALKAGTDYETLVKTRICEPLKLRSTVIKLSPELQPHLATGHDQALTAVLNWNIPTLAGAGALRSTTKDLLRFLAANMNLIESGLWPAMQNTHLVRNKTEEPNLEIGLGWHTYNNFGTQIIWHSGGTAGYRTFIGFDKKNRRGVVVLSNTAIGVDDIGLHLLENRYELLKIRYAINIDPNKLDPYVGTYQIDGKDYLIVISKYNNKLFLHRTAGPKLEILPESETEFFIDNTNSHFSFIKDTSGKVLQIVIHRMNGTKEIAVRKD